MKQIEVKQELEAIVENLQSNEGWSEPLFKDMYTNELSYEKALVLLFFYKKFVSNFFLFMLRVVSSAPLQDDKFLKLTPNVWDEVGGKDGVDLAHFALLNDLDPMIKNCPLVQSYCIENSKWVDSFIDKLEENLDTNWPLNLFSLGPGTESVSYLFLRPLTNSCMKAIERSDAISEYFKSHEPEVEFHHQDEILNVISMDLSERKKSEALSILNDGKLRALSSVLLYQSFIETAWKKTNEYN